MQMWIAFMLLEVICMHAGTYTRVRTHPAFVSIGLEVYESHILFTFDLIRNNNK